MEGRWFKQLIG